MLTLLITPPATDARLLAMRFAMLMLLFMLPSRRRATLAAAFYHADAASLIAMICVKAPFSYFVDSAFATP